MIPPEDGGGARWQRPDTGEIQKLDDEQECRRRAGAEVERETRRDRIFGDDGLARPGSLEGMMARHEATRRIAKLTAECMQRRGYGPAPK